MRYSSTRRKSDGWLSWPNETPNLPTSSEQLTSLASRLGGVAEDYEYVELSQEQFDAINLAKPGRSFLVGNSISSAIAPTAAIDRTEVPSDDTTLVTISVNVHDASYAGLVSCMVICPDNVVIKDSDNAVAGVAQFQIATPQLGIHKIELESEKHGVAFTEFTGVI